MRRSITTTEAGWRSKAAIAWRPSATHSTSTPGNSRVSTSSTSSRKSGSSSAHQDAHGLEIVAPGLAERAPKQLDALGALFGIFGQSLRQHLIESRRQVAPRVTRQRHRRCGVQHRQRQLVVCGVRRLAVSSSNARHASEYRSLCGVAPAVLRDIELNLRRNEAGRADHFFPHRAIAKRHREPQVADSRSLTLVEQYVARFQVTVQRSGSVNCDHAQATRRSRYAAPGPNRAAVHGDTSRIRASRPPPAPSP